jgi:hypothetical protein
MVVGNLTPMGINSSYFFPPPMGGTSSLFFSTTNGESLQVTFFFTINGGSLQVIFFPLQWGVASKDFSFPRVLFLHFSSS